MFRRQAMRMAPEGDAGGSGGAAGAAAAGGEGAQAGANGQPPPAPDVAAQMKAMEARLNALTQQNQQYAAIIQTAAAGGGLGGRPPQEDTQDDEYVDPAVEKQLKKLRSELKADYDRQLHGVADLADYNAFQSTISSNGVDAEVAKEAEQLYAQWQQTGFQLVDARGQLQRPTRRDALTFAAGKRHLNGYRETLTKRQKDEEARRIANQDATLPTGGGATRRPAGVPDPETLSRTDRLKDGGYYSQVLDKEGF